MAPQLGFQTSTAFIKPGRALGVELPKVEAVHFLPPAFPAHIVNVEPCRSHLALVLTPPGNRRWPSHTAARKCTSRLASPSARHRLGPSRSIPCSPLRPRRSFSGSGLPRRADHNFVDHLVVSELQW